ncbi:hypothetical protein [Oceanicella sp. SM1341]|uniref:hypothetical protein n=1 Tax=Oceanicella sp. SM1341 TaxID=1548889 RepID=UPI000E549718|nr:hypothetical protein [Oceanicella sp. SM1341]
MKIVVCGGSNSIDKDGYVPLLEERLAGRHEVENVSIGAAPSIMGAYRSKFAADFEPGDLLIWEYALNDMNHIDLKGYNEDLLLRFLEYQIRFCANRKLHFLPVILTPRPREQSHGLDSYRSRLLYMFSHYGVRPFEVSHSFRQANGITRIGAEHFNGTSHFAARGDVVQFVARGIADRVETGVLDIPQRALPLFVTRSAMVGFYSHFTGGSRSRFANRRLSIAAWDPEDGELVFDGFKHAGRLTSVAVLAAPDGGVMDLTVDDRSLRVALSHDERGFGRPMLKVLTLENLLHEPLAVSPGSRFAARWADSAENVLEDMGFKGKDTGPEHRNARIVGLIVEENA